MYRVNIDQGQNWKCRDLNATGLRFYVDSFLSLIWDFQIEFTNRTSSNFWERRPVLPWKGLSIKILQDERKMLPRLFMKNILQRRMGWSVWNTSLFVYVKVSKARCFDRDYRGERVKRIALSPPRLLAIFFAVKIAFRRYRSGRNVSIMLCFCFLNLHHDP